MSSYIGNFNQAAYQKRIDGITGTRDGRPLIKLAWAPDEFRWYPYKIGSGEPPGYTFPIFCNKRNADGGFESPKRWVLLERHEPEQYAPGWEAGRYAVQGTDVWDIKGPCPPERYLELRCHSYHDGECCPCRSEACQCGEQYDHCWGKYLEPNEQLLSWVRRVYTESVNDSDVQPMMDAQHFEAPKAQREVVNAQERALEKKNVRTEFDIEAVDRFIKQPVSVLVNGFRDDGMKRTPAGLYVPD